MLPQDTNTLPSQIWLRLHSGDDTLPSFLRFQCACNNQPRKKLVPGMHQRASFVQGELSVLVRESNVTHISCSGYHTLADLEKGPRRGIDQRQALVVRRVVVVEFGGLAEMVGEQVQVGCRGPGAPRPAQTRLRKYFGKLHPICQDRARLAHATSSP